MSSNAVAVRYAKALADLGSELGTLDAIAKDLEGFGSAVTSHANLAASLSNPSFTRAERKAVVKAVAEQLKVDPTTRNFLFLLVDNDRIGGFTDILSAFRAAWDARSGRVRAHVTSATKLDKKTLDTLKQQVALLTSATEVVLDADVDPALIGGIVTRVGDKVLDGSIRTQLNTLRTRLLGQGAVAEA